MNKLILGIITVIAYLCGSLCSAGGAVFMTGDFLSGYQIHTDEDRAGMYEYYAGQGLENYYMAGGAVGKTTVVLAATAVTGGGASAAVEGLGARGGFMLLTDAAVSSATFSAGNQYATTGTVDAQTVVRDTAIGIGTAGLLKGGGSAIGGLRNQAAAYRAAHGHSWVYGGGRANPFNYRFGENLAMGGLAPGRYVGPPGTIGGYPQGSFSIANWSGYPAGVPRPTGPFRLLSGQELQAAVAAKNRANAAMHRADPALQG